MLSLKKTLSWYGLRDEHAGAVADAVRKVETRTSGEIVPLVVGRSTEGLEATLLWALAGVATGLGAVWVEAYLHWAPLDAPWVIGTITGFAVASALVGQIPGFGRLILGRVRLERAVSRRAFSEFVEQGLTRASRRSGVLILVSLFEHRVVILGDQGVHEKVPDGFWKEHCDELGRAVRARELGAGLVREIEAIGDVLAVHFPKIDGQKSELGDELRSEE